ncbi:MAG: phosphatidylserine decarboxylase family protein [FCB group bacterium]|nr:phosphatidylserine decarboxylase family protein [FCB group bacterium]
MNKIPGRFIAPEGRRIILILFSLLILCVLTAWRIPWAALQWFIGLVFIALLFCINFFRDPSRVMPENPRTLVAPADGKVVRIKKISDPDVDESATLISIFLNVFNVHANRMPIDGTVKKVDHKPGKFLAAFDHAASDENEQTEILIQSEKGPFKVKQIAGLIARRILCYGKPGQALKRGERLGFIMFGSRTDIILPASVSVKIELGDSTKGGETILGEWI